MEPLCRPFCRAPMLTVLPIRFRPLTCMLVLGIAIPLGATAWQAAARQEEGSQALSQTWLPAMDLIGTTQVALREARDLELRALSSLDPAAMSTPHAIRSREWRLVLDRARTALTSSHTLLTGTPAATALEQAQQHLDTYAAATRTALTLNESGHLGEAQALSRGRSAQELSLALSTLDDAILHGQAGQRAAADAAAGQIDLEQTSWMAALMGLCMGFMGFAGMATRALSRRARRMRHAQVPSGQAASA